MAFDDRARKLHSDNVRLIAIMKGEAANTTLAISITQPKHYSVALDDRAGKLHSDNVRLIAIMKGEAANTTLAILITKPKPYSVALTIGLGNYTRTI